MCGAGPCCARSKAAENETQLLRNEVNAIAPTRIAFITTDASASASELVPNSMIPYLGDNLGVGRRKILSASRSARSASISRPAICGCARSLSKTVNADDQGEYFTGLASVVPNTCRAGDDITRPLGDPQEASIAAALDFLGGRSCTPIAAAGADAARRRRSQPVTAPSGGELDLPERRMLRPQRPNAAPVRDNPGLF